MKLIRAFSPVIVVFIVTTIILAVVPDLSFLWQMDKTVMIVGNAILFIATTISFLLFARSLGNNNVYGFMRMIYGGMFAKMLICLFAAVIYIMAAKKGVSKGAIFGCMFLYFVYTFLEISIIMKLSRKDRYAKDRSTT
ncbi:MAG: hypothetical protein JNK79_19155 [Chitinophagaceae bacterium]|nr:hypothetical protein [Chitinophagaceae bacterium]